MSQYWAIRPVSNGFEVWTEDGEYLASFVKKESAEEVVDDHNLGVEMDQPPTPEVERTIEQQRAERLAAWKEHDPSGRGVIEQMFSATDRLQRLLSLNAPRIILANAIKSLRDKVEVLEGLYPDEEDATP